MILHSEKSIYEKSKEGKENQKNQNIKTQIID